MPMKSNHLLTAAIALLGFGLVLNAFVNILDRHGTWPDQVAWGKGLQVVPSGAFGNADIQAFPVQLGRNIYGFVLLDPSRHAMAVYRLNGAVSRLRLMAARNYRYDLRLKDFNNSSPTPVQVKKLLGAGAH